MQKQNEPVSKEVLASGGNGDTGMGLATNAADVSRERWRHLEARADSWRKQLSLKWRNLTVGQLVSTIRANKLTTEQAGANLDVPREAIEEALAYYEENRALIEEEAEAERRWLAERGYPLEPHNIP